MLFPKIDYPEDTEDFITRGQHLGIAWRSDRAKMVGEPFSIPVGKHETFGNKFWERRANAIKFSFGEGKTDVVLIPVHLKSNRNDANPSDKQFTQKQRLAEAKVFVASNKFPIAQITTRYERRIWPGIFIVPRLRIRVEKAGTYSRIKDTS